MDINEKEKEFINNKKLEYDYNIKRKIYENISKKSYILQKNKIDDDNKVSQYMEQLKIKEKIKDKVNNSKLFSKIKLFYFMSKNTELITSILIELNSLWLLHPLYNFQIRTQANNAYRDVANLKRNNILKDSLFRGFSYSIMYSSVNLFFYFYFIKTFQNYLSKINIVKEVNVNMYSEMVSDFCSLPLRLLIEIKRQNFIFRKKQTINGFLKNYFYLYVPMLSRDIIFRLFYNKTYQYICFEKNQKYIGKKSKYITYADIPYHVRSFGIIFSSFLACMFSMPFDVIITKYNSQQIDAYKGLLDCYKQIVKEEGIGKLLTAGLSMRSAQYMLSGTIFLSMYNTLYPITKGAFNHENILYL